MGNLKQLTIQFFDSCGAPLEFEGLADVKMLKNNDFPINDLRHPLNKKVQVFLSFIVGVVESQVNTNTKFEH